MNDVASFQAFFFLAFSLAGVKVEPALPMQRLSKCCPVSVFHDRVYGKFVY